MHSKCNDRVINPINECNEEDLPLNRPHIFGYWNGMNIYEFFPWVPFTPKVDYISVRRCCFHFFKKFFAHFGPSLLEMNAATMRKICSTIFSKTIFCYMYISMQKKKLKIILNKGSKRLLCCPQFAQPATYNY